MLQWCKGKGQCLGGKHEVVVVLLGTQQPIACAVELHFIDEFAARLRRFRELRDEVTLVFVRGMASAMRILMPEAPRMAMLR